MKSSSADLKTERGRTANQASPAVTAVSAATQLHLQYKPGLLFLSTADFLPRVRGISPSRAGQMQPGYLRLGSRFATWLVSPNRDIQSLAHGPGFVNARFGARGALRAWGKGLENLGHTIYEGQALSMPFDHTTVFKCGTTGGRIQDIPGRIE